MDCQKCSSKPATVFLTHVAEGGLQRTDLCEECAKKAGAMHPSGFFEEKSIFARSPEKSTSAIKCPACGYSSEDLQKTGRVGCASCYEQFSGSLQVALAEAQKGLLHLGKRPARRNASPEVWQAEMNHFVATENFEAAARLRDKISLAQKKKQGSRGSL